MIKYILILVTVFSLGIVACGNNSTTSTETTDSTAVAVDSFSPTANDSTTAQITDSTLNQQ